MFVENSTPLYLAEAGGVDRLRVVLLTEVQVVDVQRAPGDTHALRQLVVLL